MKKPDRDDKKRADIKERLCHSLDIQPDIFPFGTLIELRGRNLVTVRGAGAVSVYTDTQIRLACKDADICILGERLCCTSYRKGTAVIDGRILSVSFEEVQK
jgi:hypothetical protein